MSKFQGTLSRAVLLEDLSYLGSMGESVHSHLSDKRLPRGALRILPTPPPAHHADAYTLTEHPHLPEGDVLLSFFLFNFFFFRIPPGWTISGHNHTSSFLLHI